jgi:hypothetical protein
VSDVCRSCKQPVRWAVTAGGYCLTVDRDPVAGGNLRLERNPRDLPRAVAVPPTGRGAGERLFVAHSRTCPYGER